jgi:hypothetical protein
MTEFTPQNIKYLRTSVGLTIKGLGAVVELDPVDIYLFEKDEYRLRSEHTVSVTKIANYFAVYLDELVYSNIQSNGIANEKLELLKLELAGEKEFDRRSFSNSLLYMINKKSMYYMEPGVLSPDRLILRLMQMNLRMEQKYNYLLAKGLLDKDDFLGFKLD